MIDVNLKPNNKPTKAGFYLVQRQKHKHLINRILSALVVQNEYYNRGELFLFLGELSCFPLDDLEEDCLWSDEIVVLAGQKENN